MLEELDDYLVDATTPEIRNMILTACRTLLEAGIDDQEFTLRNAIDIAENRDFDAVYESILSTLKPIYTAALKEFGVEVDPDAELPVLTQILSGLQSIDNWDDPVTLNALADSSESEEVVLADILSAVGTLYSADYLPAIRKVSPDLLSRIKELTDKDVPDAQPEQAAVVQARERLKVLHNRQAFPVEGVFMRSLNQGLRLGLPYDLLVGPYKDALYDVLPESLGPELVAFALASDTPTPEIPVLLAKIKTELSLSVTDLMAVDARIRTLLQHLPVIPLKEVSDVQA